jgi:hypothetical protein
MPAGWSGSRRTEGRKAEENDMYKMTEAEIAERTEYVAWRRRWRAEYAALTTKIRADKIACKDAQRAGDGGGHQDHLRRIRSQAAEMMVVRTEKDAARRMALQKGPAKAA